MSNSRDPFPMRSEAAAKLAASVSTGDPENNDGDWNKMGTSTDGVQPSKEAISLANTSDATGTSLISNSRSSSFSNSRKKGYLYDDDDSDDEDGANDDFIDRPINKPSKIFLEKLILKLYGPSLPVHEFLRILSLSSTLFFLIGGYWLLRSLKDPVLTAICGVEAIPKAKMLSVFVVLGVVTVYNKLLDTDIPKHKLFFLFGTFYFFLFSSISYLLTHPTIGLPNQKPELGRILGWVSYCSIESFGSVMVSLFWSFTNSSVSLETAKAGFGLLVAVAQVGSIIGPTIINKYAGTWGLSKCYFAGACCMLFFQGTMWLYVRLYGAESSEKKDQNSGANVPKKEKAGVVEGLVLFWKHHYIKGIFAISCLFMVEVTIVDFTMKVLAKEHFNELYPCVNPADSCYGAEGSLSTEAVNAFTTFMGLFGQATNTLSLFLSLFGTSAVIRKLGLRTTLLVFPSLCLIIIIWIRFHPTLWTVFGAMMLLKANSYALNNPTKEILYQPTSSAVKYKAKSWIDIFGARGSKALGSVVTNAFSDSATHLVQNGSLVGMTVATFLIYNATFMGRKFDEFTETGYIVGGEEDEYKEVGGSTIEVAMGQNEVQDTSCALSDDEEEEEDDGFVEEDLGGNESSKPAAEVQMV